MRVAFLFYGPLQPAIAQVMIESVRRWLPEATLTQLTNKTSMGLPMVDEVRRIEGSSYGYLLLKHMQELPPPFIRIDYDMILQADLTPILDDDFDVALNEQGDATTIKTEFGRKYPIAGSVWAAKTERAHEFARVYRRKHIASGLDDWLGLVPVLNEIVQSREFKVKTLPGEVYNYAPRHREDKPAQAAVLHYKGARKRWMFPQNEERIAYPDEKRISTLIDRYPHQEELGENRRLRVQAKRVG